MPSPIATHASLLLKAAAAAASPKPLFSPRAAQIPAPLAGRACPRWFRWPASARGLCSSTPPNHSGPAHGMGSDANGTRRRVPPVNGLSKEGATQPVPAPPKLLTLPTVLTIGRVAAVPFLISTFYMDGPWAATATTGIFLAAAITDWLDGYIARKMHLGTPFGAFLDPVADKLMVAATLVLLCTKPLEASLLSAGPWLLTVPSIAIIGREITMSAVREWAASQNTQVLEAVAVNNLGKWKTATQMIALTLLLASRDPSLPVQGALVAPGVALLYASAGLAIWSLVVYIRNIWRILLK
ncbi:cardiolipin synthase (CMP-forming), mitochondrial [Lolium rigidum]|uniref:cardiolipin synthase (CMP-forming), mitochondrial n=1 Tax=Lolium rigidum TaxID=89674 RepID=UPI001F5CC821|nr:cardiolipin synthase (CMP-forming), mitochondrial [Lolium rigidum]